jgi:hypothetical protein
LNSLPIGTGVSLAMDPVDTIIVSVLAMSGAYLCYVAMGIMLTH